ncbi:MAG: nickel-responsive transcriptional regulator NikR [Campylobacter sp.]
MKENIIRFSISLPQNLLEILDSKVSTQEYASRSEFIRDLIRSKIIKDKWEKFEGELTGVLTILYDHHQTDLLYNKTELEHHAKIKVICTTHVHIDHNHCLETLFLQGHGADIMEFKNQIAGMKNVQFAQIAQVALPQKTEQNCIDHNHENFTFKNTEHTHN